MKWTATANYKLLNPFLDQYLEVYVMLIIVKQKNFQMRCNICNISKNRDQTELKLSSSDDKLLNEPPD